MDQSSHGKRLTGLLAFLALITAFAGATADVVSVDPSASPIPEREGRNYLRDFTQAQFVELKQMRDRHARELKELVEQQKKELAEYEEKGRVLEKTYIDEHRGKGKEIRPFIKQHRAEHDAFKKTLIETRKK